MRRTLLLGVLLALCSLLIVSFTEVAAANSPGQQAGSGAAASTEVKAGLGIENLELTGASDSFKIAADTKIYGWSRVKDVSPGSSVVLAFKKGDKEIYRREVSVPSVPYRINAWRTFRAGDAGDWKLVVTGADGKELGSTSFKVEITK